ncbi:MAG: hypothetical protein IPM45_18295 [Acidimicrobiales bacterium]|nr:hypothetical protein [Acidimicrobiales bacterium]
MQPQRKRASKATAAGEEAGLDRADVEHILGTFREDGEVTKKGTFETILDLFDRMDFQGADYQSPIEPAPGFDPEGGA